MEDHPLFEKLSRAYFYIKDDSEAFRLWLTRHGICYDDAGSQTGIPDNIDLFLLGYEWAKANQ